MNSSTLGRKEITRAAAAHLNARAIAKCNSAPMFHNISDNYIYARYVVIIVDSRKSQ